MSIRLPLEPLTFREYRDCTVMPYRRRRGERGGWELGVFDASGVCIEETLVHHHLLNGEPRQVGFPAAFHPAERTLAGPAIYLGPLSEHFGHFLLESLSRIWLAGRHPELPVVWSRRIGPKRKSGTEPLLPWQRDILAMIGATNPSVFVEQPTRFERLIVPDLGNHFQLSFHPEHAEALAAIPYAPVPGRRLWLSRSKLDVQLQNLSMSEVERGLVDLGWTIVHPETLPFPEQVAHLAAAEQVAGEQGSALHAVLFLKNPQGLRLDVFLGDPEHPVSRRGINYNLIGAVKGIDQRYHIVSSEIVTRRRGTGFRVEKYSSDIGEYFEKLGIDAKPPGSMAATPPPPAAPDARPANSRPAVRSGSRAGAGKKRTSAPRINRLCTIRPAERYLEIGVSRGNTFLAVDIATKHAVDPQFRFDTASHETADVRFFPITSDAYFTYEAPTDLRFDIIFLDGLHTFEQTFRDFCASMAHAHRDTIWILDDVFPSDVFSALPSQEDAHAFRRQHGLGQKLWHGDVYKCIFAINDFFPNFSFRTFEPAHSNPQTVVVNRPRLDFAPHFNDLEKISRLDYYGFWENRTMLNLLPEEEVFDWVATMMKPAPSQDRTK